MSETAKARYTAVAIVLHWAIAVAIIGNLVLGWWMHRAIDVPGEQARAIAVFQLHKSLGLTVLLLSLLRLAWRLLHRPPQLPAAMPAWEKFGAKATHWAFYVLMVAIPLSGWLYTSTQWRGSAPLTVPTLWFRLFEVPHLFGLDTAARETREEVAGIALGAHFWLAWGAAVLLVLHVVAALKHHFINRDETLANMLPVVKAQDQERLPGEWGRRAVLWSGSTAIFIAAIALGVAVFSTPRATNSSAAPAAISDLPDSTWSVSAASEIVFSGEHAGTPFEGRFTQWRARIQFDPANPAGSSIVVEIEPGSARDGNTLHEETLPQAEWFDVAGYPIATFRSSSIRPAGDRFEVVGSLTLKGRELQLTPLILTLEGEQLAIEGRVVINRREANLGMDSDPDAEWVSGEIPVDVRLTARRAGT